MDRPLEDYPSHIPAQVFLFQVF